MVFILASAAMPRPRAGPARGGRADSLPNVPSYIGVPVIVKAGRYLDAANATMGGWARQSSQNGLPRSDGCNETSTHRKSRNPAARNASS